MAPLWTLGRFTCELCTRSEPPFLAVLQDREPIIEVTVQSAFEADQQADLLRAIVEEHLVSASDTKDRRTR